MISAALFAVITNLPIVC